MLALGVPDVDALSAREDDGQRVVVVGGELVLGGDGTLGRRRVVPVLGRTAGAAAVGAAADRGGVLVCVWRHGVTVGVLFVLGCVEG